MPGLRLMPITWREARDFIEEHHRHSVVPQGGKFAVAAVLDDRVVGVAVAGRPVSRILDDGYTLEVTRVATDGTRNACSFLYGAVRRAGRAMGYLRFVTYTLPGEGGASLRASGWTLAEEVGRGGSWDCPSRPRVNNQDQRELRLRWEA